MQLVDYYEILQIPYNATPGDIRSAFWALAKQYHPDLNPGYSNQAKMQQINEAYAVLSQPVRKALYDFILFGQLAGESPREQPTSRPDGGDQEVDIREGLVVFRPLPFQREMSRFILFIMRWQERFLGILLAIMFLGLVFASFDLWELGGGLVGAAGILGLITLLLISLAQLFDRIGVRVR